MGTQAETMIINSVHTQEPTNGMAATAKGVAATVKGVAGGRPAARKCLLQHLGSGNTIQSKEWQQQSNGVAVTSHTGVAATVKGVAATVKGVAICVRASARYASDSCGGYTSNRYFCRTHSKKTYSTRHSTKKTLTV